MKGYDLIVVGGGIAGAYGARAAARMGLEVLLVSLSLDKEIDATKHLAQEGRKEGLLHESALLAGGFFGGEGRKMTSSPGAASISRIKEHLEGIDGISFWQDLVEGLSIKSEKVSGIQTMLGGRVPARAVLISTGGLPRTSEEVSLKSFAAHLFASRPKNLMRDLISFGHRAGGLNRAEGAKIVRAGYAVEYDYVLPDQLRLSLESKLIEGLFFAGQIIGTTGYEEAAALGLMAGINAALKVKGEPPLILVRSQAYIGVLIDDLVTKEHTEPYRIYTSRAEHRLILREDDAGLRLSRIGCDLGLIGQEEMELVERKREA